MKLNLCFIWCFSIHFSAQWTVSGGSTINKCALCHPRVDPNLIELKWINKTIGRSWDSSFLSLSVRFAIIGIRSNSCFGSFLNWFICIVDHFSVIQQKKRSHHHSLHTSSGDPEQTINFDLSPMIHSLTSKIEKLSVRPKRCIIKVNPCYQQSTKERNLHEALTHCIVSIDGQWHSHEWNLLIEPINRLDRILIDDSSFIQSNRSMYKNKVEKKEEKRTRWSNPRMRLSIEENNKQKDWIRISRHREHCVLEFLDEK